MKGLSRDGGGRNTEDGYRSYDCRCGSGGRSHTGCGRINDDVRLDVRGCEGCTFIAHDGSTWGGSWKKVAMSTQVTNGMATIRVPRRDTPTTSLEVVHPDGLGAQNATALVAFTWTKANGYWSGGICWGKRKGVRARLNIVGTEFTGRAVPGAPKGRFIRARLAKLPVKAQAGVNGSPGCPEYRR